MSDGLTQKMQTYESFNLGAARGEQPMRFEVGHAGTRVCLKVVGQSGVIVAFLEPAQARELSASLSIMADNCQQWEGIAGNVRRDAEARPPSIRMTMPSGGIV
jgi:hypothetical protein